MSGAHRMPKEPLPRKVKWARRLRAIVIIAAFPASFGALIYVMVIGTYLMASVVLWVMWTSLLAWVAVRRRTDLNLVLLTAGIVVSASWQVVSALAQQNGWPAHQQHVVALTGDWLRALLTVLFVASIVIGIRSGELTWPPWRLSENDRADLG